MGYLEAASEGRDGFVRPKGMGGARLIDLGGGGRYARICLVFGKTVQIRRYPVTVSTESLAIVWKATGSGCSWEGSETR